jgi:hypothetical protein
MIHYLALLTLVENKTTWRGILMTMETTHLLQIILSIVLVSLTKDFKPLFRKTY